MISFVENNVLISQVSSFESVLVERPCIFNKAMLNAGGGLSNMSYCLSGPSPLPSRDWHARLSAPPKTFDGLLPLEGL